MTATGERETVVADWRRLPFNSPNALAPVNGSSNGAAFFDHQAVEAKFASGGLLLDAGAYKLDAGRREAPGEVEYHAHTVDVMHVVDGSATAVTGGEMLGAAQCERRRSPCPSGHRRARARARGSATYWRCRPVSRTSSPGCRIRFCTSS